MGDIEALKLENEKLKAELERIAEQKRLKNKEYHRTFYLNHKEKCVDSAKKWAKDNPEKKREVWREASRRYYERQKIKPQVISSC